MTALFSFFLLFFMSSVSNATLEDSALQPNAVRVKAENSYQSAIELFKNQNYEDAKEKFLEVETIKRGYKSTWTFLKRTEDLIAYNHEQTLQDQKQAWEREKRERERDILMAERLRQAHISENERKVRLTAEREEARVNRDLEEKQDRIKSARASAEFRRKIEVGIEKEERRREAEELRMARLEKKEELRLQREKIAEKKKLLKSAVQDDSQPTEVFELVKADTGQSADDMHRKQELEQKLKASKRQKGAHDKFLKSSQAKITALERREKIRRIKELYREVKAMKKARRLMAAKDHIAELQMMLADEILPDSYRRKMTAKVDVLSQSFMKASEKKASAQRHKPEADKQLALAETKDEDSIDEKMRIRIEHLEAKRRLQENKKIAKEQKDLEKKMRRQEKELEKKRKQDAHFKRKELALQKKNEKKERKRLEKEMQKKITYRPDPKISAMENDIRLRKQEALKGMETRRAVVQKDRQQLQKEFTQGLFLLYEDAVRLYKSGALHISADLFSELERLSPDYKMTRQYIVMINASLGRQLTVDETVRQSIRLRQQVVSETLDDFQLR